MRAKVEIRTGGMMEGREVKAMKRRGEGVLKEEVGTVRGMRVVVNSVGLGAS
jgi:hypothetical protein